MGRDRDDRSIERLLDERGQHLMGAAVALTSSRADAGAAGVRAEMMRRRGSRLSGGADQSHGTTRGMDSGAATVNAGRQTVAQARVAELAAASICPNWPVHKLLRQGSRVTGVSNGSAGPSVAVAVADLGDRGHVDGVVDAPVPTPKTSVSVVPAALTTTASFFFVSRARVA